MALFVGGNADVNSKRKEVKRMAKMKMLVSISVALALLLALVPTAAFAATEGESAGDFTLGNVAPVVNSITPSADPMTPQYEWTTITVNVNDDNTLADVDEVEVQLFYDSAGTDPVAPGSADVQTCAILTWSRGSGFSIAPAATTWALDAGGCTPGDDGNTTDNWVFSFKVGSVATEPTGSGNWDIYAKATDAAAATGDAFERDAGMNWYGEVAVDLTTTTFSFGSVSLGVSQQPSSAVIATYIANGDYNQQIKTDSGAPDYAAKWVSASNEVTLRVSGTTPDAGEMVLQADDDDTPADAVQVVQAAYTTFDTGTITGESGNPETDNHLWLSLGASGIVADTYNGTVYYQILND